MTTSKTLIRCKLVVNGKIIQMVKFKYLGIEISDYEDVEAEVHEQTMK